MSNNTIISEILDSMESVHCPTCGGSSIIDLEAEPTSREGTLYRCQVCESVFEDGEHSRQEVRRGQAQPTGVNVFGRIGPPVKSTTVQRIMDAKEFAESFVWDLTSAMKSPTNGEVIDLVTDAAYFRLLVESLADSQHYNTKGILAIEVSWQVVFRAAVRMQEYIATWARKRGKGEDDLFLEVARDKADLLHDEFEKLLRWYNCNAAPLRGLG